MTVDRRRTHPPPQRCAARSKQSGERCRRWASPGLHVCVAHGGAPESGGPAMSSMGAKAGASVTLATTLAARLDGRKRPIWEVVLDAVSVADSLMQQARHEITSGGDIGPDALQRLADATRMAHQLAASAVTVRAIDVAAGSAEKWADIAASRVVALLSDHLGLTPGPDGRVAQALNATMGDIDLTTDPSDPPAPTGPPLLDLVGRAVAGSLAGHLGVPVESLSRWFAQVIESVDAGTEVPPLPVALAAIEAAPLSPPDPMEALDPEPEPAPEVLSGEVVDAPRRTGRRVDPHDPDNFVMPATRLSPLDR